MNQRQAQRIAPGCDEQGARQPKAPPGINPLRLVHLYMCVCMHTCRVCLCSDRILLPLTLPTIPSYINNQHHAYMSPRTRPTSLNYTNTPDVLCCPADAGGAASNRGAACPAAGGAPAEPSVPAEEEVQRLPGAGPQPAGGGAGGPAGGHGPIRQQQPLAGSHWRQVCVCVCRRTKTLRAGVAPGASCLYDTQGELSYQPRSSAGMVCIGLLSHALLCEYTCIY